jgi:hypothetical protein
MKFPPIDQEDSVKTFQRASGDPSVEHAQTLASGASDCSAGSIVDALRAGPALLDVPVVANVLDVSKAGLYASIKRGDAPVRCIKVGGRIKVLTSSLIELFEQGPGTEKLRSA